MRGTKAMKATAACMLRLVPGSGGCRASTAQPAASVSLLERIRDVVLRLIMLSVVSRASVQRNTSSGKAKASSPRAGWQRYSDASVAEACRRDDSIRNEAVEDCIEFLKRSSADGDAAKMSSVSVSTAEGVAADACTAKMWCVTASDAKLSGAGSEEEMATFVVVDFEARREASPGA